MNQYLNKKYEELDIVKLLSIEIYLELKMPKAIWNGKVLAESEKTEVVEGNQYFPPNSIKQEFFQTSTTHTSCPWKGKASYYTIVVDGKSNPDAAWYYPETKERANNIKGYVAFWKGVQIES